MLQKSYTAFVGELRRCEVRCANKISAQSPASAAGPSAMLAAMAHTGCKGCPQACQPCLRQALGIQLFNIHPGTTSGLCEPEVSMRGIAAGINRALGETRGVCVVLENVAGQARAAPLAPSTCASW